MKTKLVSIDSSTKKSGMALFVNGELTDYILIDFSNDKNSYTRMASMILSIANKLDEWMPDVLYIEHPQGEGRNVLVVSQLSKILGAVLLWCSTHNCQYEEIMPSVWRKYAGISQGGKKRNELKQASIDYIKNMFGIDANDDLADAIAIGTAVYNYFKEV